MAVHSALGEKGIAKYHDIYLVVFNLYDIYPPQTSVRHAQTPSRHPKHHPDTRIFGLREAIGLGEKSIDEYHDIYSTVFNLSDIYPPQAYYDRLKNVEVRLTDKLPTSRDEMYTEGELLGIFWGPGKRGEVVKVEGSARTGRYVLIQMNNRKALNLHEVEVFGQKFTN